MAKIPRLLLTLIFVAGICVSCASQQTPPPATAPALRSPSWEPVVVKTGNKKLDKKIPGIVAACKGMASGVMLQKEYTEVVRRCIRNSGYDVFND